jgi:hypothetical protein
VSLQAALVLARQVALEAVELMEGPSPLGHDDGQLGSPSDALNSSIVALTEQVASFGTYHNKGFPKLSGTGGGSHSNSRSNSTDQRGSGDHSVASSSSVGSGGLRFPSMPWSNSRKEKSSKKADSASNTSIVASSPVAKAETDVAREFVYDAHAKMGDTPLGAGHDAFSGEGAELERPRSLGVDREVELPSPQIMQETEYDDTGRFPEHVHFSTKSGATSERSDEEIQFNSPPTQKSPDIPIRSGGSSARTPHISSAAHPSHHGVPSNAPGTAITSSGGHSGGVLSTFSSAGWSFPVVRALHNMTGTKSCVPEHNQPGAGAAKAAARAHTKQMKALERRGQWVQQQIIDIDRCATISAVRCLPHTWPFVDTTSELRNPLTFQLAPRS